MTFVEPDLSILDEEAPNLDGGATGDKLACDRCGKVCSTTQGLAGHKLFCGKPKKEKAKTEPSTPSVAKPPAPRGAKPRVSTKRIALDDKLGMAWGGAGSMLVPAISPMAARAMVLQAPAAGAVLDDLIADTKIDKALQRFAGKGKKVEGLGALIGLPFLMVVIEKNPVMVMHPVIDSLLDQVITANIAGIIDARVKEKRKAEELAAKAAEAGIDLNVQAPDGTTVSLVQQIKSELLAPLYARVAEGQPQAAEG